MRKCSECGSRMIKGLSSIEGAEYEFYKCTKCGDEVIDMGQLHDLSGKWREVKRYKAKLTPWGKSLGIRIPRELVKKYALKGEVTLIPDDKGITISP